jgi:hypothetical protein
LHSFVFAQAARPDNTSVNTALQNTIDFYYASIGENAHLYIGSEHTGYNTSVTGHPYLDTTEMQIGSIFCSGILYKNIPLLYDIANDEIIINKYKQSYLISLPHEKIGFFSIRADTFVMVMPDTAARNLPAAGFYNRIYNGKTLVLVKRKKILNEDPPANGASKFHYVQRNTYFVKKEKTYFRVTSKRSLFKLFDDKGKDIRRYLRKNKINFNDQPEYAIAQAARYYDSLTN